MMLQSEMKKLDIEDKRERIERRREDKGETIRVGEAGDGCDGRREA